MASIQHQYTSVAAERYDHDDSSTEVAESVIDLTEDPQEKDWEDNNARRQRRSRFQRACATVKAWRWAVDTVLLVIILALLLERRWDQSARDDAASRKQEIGGDLTGFAPKFDRKIVTFKPSEEYIPANASDFFDAKVTKKWIELVPQGLGFVKVEHPEDYDNLPHPLADYSDTVFTTSMTHQLHCLYAIIETYSDLATSTRRHKHNHDWHIGHCFEYLRQSIMCCGDVALEGAETTFPPGAGGSDGWDAKHVCRDYTQVYDYLKSNRAIDDVWI